MKHILAASLIALASIAQIAHASTAYVSDTLTITLRTGESTQHQVLRTLESGAALEVISHNKESGYSHVRLQNGTEGYVLTRYTQDTPIARHQLAAAQKRTQQLNTKVTELETKLKQVKQDASTLGGERSNLTKENASLKKELDHIRSISSSALAINEQNQHLNTRIINLETTIQSLEQENLILKDRSARDWFIAGVGVALLGIVIGLIAPRISFKKRASWNQL